MQKGTYQDASLSPKERALDLLKKMSLEEKLGQLQCFNPISYMGKDPKSDFPQGFGQVTNLLATAMPDPAAVAEMVNQNQRLAMQLSEHHIPALFHIEALCGVLAPQAKSFPAGIGQAATWDPELQHQVGLTIGTQARAIGMSQVAAPVLDITRDPRFGRIGEGYGEDPTLGAAMGTAYVKGLQHDGSQEKGVLATAKHFLGFQRGEGGIHSARTPIPPRELREVYAKPFQAAITDGQMGAIMNSYGEIDGEPVSGSKKILTDLLRKEMQFNGYVVSDYQSIDRLKTEHKVCESFADAGERALKAGMDAELPGISCYGPELLERIKNGELDVKYLDRAVLDTLVAKFKLGLFEEPFAQPKEKIQAAYQDPSADDISRRAADESLVLLKNDGILPLNPIHQKIAVIGCHADSVRSYFGGYSYMAMKESTVGVQVTMAGIDVDSDSPESHAATVKTYPGSIVHQQNEQVEPLTRKCYPHSLSLLDSLKQACPYSEITYAYGYPYAGNDESHFDEALKAAKDADIVILTLGGKYGWNMSSTTGEGIDAQNIGLPACQEAFLKAVAPLDKPMIGIHFDGRPISSDRADSELNAIIEAWAPGENGGAAIVGALLGHLNPSGKLPVSVARNAGQIPVYYNHDHGSGTDTGASAAFNTYVDGPRTPRYPFGYGLSYATFKLSNLKLACDHVKPDQEIIVSVDVTNTSTVTGDEVVQLYFSDQYASVVRPVKQLAGFYRVGLTPGQTKQVTFRLQPSLMSFPDEEMRWKVEAGKFDLLIGTSSEDLPLKATVEVDADQFINGATRQFVAEAFETVKQ